MQVKSIAECSNGSILQYFRPSFSYHLSLISLFCLFLSGHFTQVLLNIYAINTKILYPVFFYPGQTDKTWSIRLRDDDIYEESETLFIELIDPVFVVLENPDIVEVTIVDPEDGKFYIKHPEF